MQIRKYNELALEALQEIRDYQEGKKLIIKTGRPYLDDIFPVVCGSVVSLCAPSGVGKSFEMMRIINNIMDTSMNPEAKDFVFLTVHLEMKIFNLVLRDLGKKIGKRKLDIIKEGFTEEEQLLAREYAQKLRDDDRHYISQTPTNPTQFYESCKAFLEQHKDKKLVGIGFDHVALLNVEKGGSRNSTIENFIEYVNNLKLEYPNVVFFLVSQTNGDMLKRARDKDRQSQPLQTDLYYSGFTFQISDYVVVLVSPFKMGITEYSKLPVEKYPNLEEYFMEEDTRGRASLQVYGVIYYHLLKCREAEDGDYLDVYAEDLNIDGVKDRRKKIMEERTNTAPTIGNFQMPVFNKLPTIETKDAF